MACDCVSIWVCVFHCMCVCVYVRALEEKQHDKPCTSVLMLICQCAADRSKPAQIRPPSSQTSNPDRFTPSSARAAVPHPTPFTFPREIRVLLERRGRESKRAREALCPHTPSETTLLPRATVTDLTAAAHLHPAHH